MAERKLAAFFPDSWAGRPARELVCWTRTASYQILVRQEEYFPSVFCEALGLGDWGNERLEKISYFQPRGWNAPIERWEIILPREIFADVTAALQICRYAAVIGEFAVTDGERFEGDLALWREFHNGESWEDSHPQLTLGFSGGHCQ